MSVKMKILITGNAGMIGSILATNFINRGFDVVGIDDLSGGFRRNIHSKAHFYPVSILDVKSINNIFEIEKPKYVIHAACFAAECLSPFIRNFISQNIVVGTTNIINACINYSVKKIIHFSSIARYGNITPPFRETDIPKPIDVYGIYKLTNELDLQEAATHFGLEYSIIAPHNVISQFQSFEDKYRNVCAIFIRKCMLGEDLSVFGDGEQKRAFSDATFLCDSIYRLTEEYNGHLFNIGSDNEITILELAKTILKIGQKLGYHKSSIVHLEPRLEVKHAISDHTKAKELLGFQDKTDLEKILMQMFKFAKLNKLIERPIKNKDYEITKDMYSYWK